jgi:hypothetical protein
MKRFFYYWRMCIHVERLYWHHDCARWLRLYADSRPHGMTPMFPRPYP